MGALVADVGSEGQSTAPPVSRHYAWVVFALTFGLLLSDYMSRQVLNAVFPLLKADWGLSDTQLGSLSGIVALMVGLLTFPLSLLADRWGRVKSLILMAVLWSLATLGCALANSYTEMFAARFFVGVGEAAYGSVGIALILSIFPRHMRSTLTGAFMAGGAFGSVLGMALGGVVAVHLGWRWSFAVMTIFGLILALLYSFIVKEGVVTPQKKSCGDKKIEFGRKTGFRAVLSALFFAPSVVCAYVGSGLQLFMMATMIAWMPSYLNRYYSMPTDKSAMLAGVFVLIGASGMIVCGAMTDRLSRQVPHRKWYLAIAYCLVSLTLLTVAFLLDTGTLQLALIGAGMLLIAGTSGPAGAMVANLTPTPIHATAFATLTLANSAFGLAPGPFVTGLIADHFGLLTALQVAPAASLAAAAAFAIGSRHYAKDLRRLNALREQPTAS